MENNPIEMTDYFGFTRTFNTTLELSQALQTEIFFWKDVQAQFAPNDDTALPDLLKDSFQRLDSLYQAINGVSALKNPGFTRDWDRNKLDRRKVDTYIIELKNNWVFKDNSITPVLLEVSKAHGPDVAKGFICYLFGTGFEPSNVSSFKGALLAYQHCEAGSVLTKRISNQKQSLESILDKVHTEAKDGLSGIAKLREAYEQHLQLSTSAKYWGRRALINGLLGVAYILAICGVAFYALGFFTKLFEGWLEVGNQEISINTAQGVVLVIIFIALFTFVLRLLSKLALSSFHIMQDSSERRYLTMFYLSLLTEGNIEDSCRGVVIQSLFSRSDTGLLSGDQSGVSFPDNVAKDLIKYNVNK